MVTIAFRCADAKLGAVCFLSAPLAPYACARRAGQWGWVNRRGLDPRRGVVELAALLRALNRDVMGVALVGIGLLVKPFVGQVHPLHHKGAQGD
jgi:hypothetical protein